MVLGITPGLECQGIEVLGRGPETPRNCNTLFPEFPLILTYLKSKMLNRFNFVKPLRKTQNI